jgi:hypothetical protein
LRKARIGSEVLLDALGQRMRRLLVLERVHAGRIAR